MRLAVSRGLKHHNCQPVSLARHCGRLPLFCVKTERDGGNQQPFIAF